MSSSSRGVLLVVSSPSGAGKTTLCRRLRGEFPNLAFSVSYTTRKPRSGEVDGKDYHFVDKDTFQEMIARDEFAEYAMVHGNLYGTSVAAIERALSAGRDVLFDVDYQGGEMLRKRFGEEVVLVFILPPSIAELERRLRARGTDDEATIARRLRVAREELRHYHEYDYLVMNDDLERAYDALRAIYVAQLHVRSRMEPKARRVLESAGPETP
ncbi:MAG: guanylate kinase [Deltaproteobacteria bacterium]|nr:MAG: guanylate kinase [Deltaproteobacteria bacterium]